ncbi:uncharacterized protein LOC130285325 [Hyla sarda]|uniref:uncharacterized protein LOC130285325 n=1 Tax=Hyla sarda TaxID=327740 RepID=UPI0024C2399B|nr:uncharacterized protein LOC130285325 [Hyla sarda]
MNSSEKKTGIALTIQMAFIDRCQALQAALQLKGELTCDSNRQQLHPALPGGIYCQETKEMSLPNANLQKYDSNSQQLLEVGRTEPKLSPDSQVSGIMGRKGVIYILVLFAGLLLSEHGAQGQTTSVTPTEPTTTTCPSYADAAQSLCSSVTGISDMNAFLASDDLSDACSHSMLQYGCADLKNVPASTLTTILNCFLQNNMTVSSQQSYSLIISQISTDKLGVVLNNINNMIPSSSISEINKEYVLNAVWENLRNDPNFASAGFVATWFQEKLYSFLPAINLDILNCMNSLPMSCDAFEAVVSALDITYSKFDQDKKEQIGSWITRFIQAHSCTKASTAESIKIYYKGFISNVNVTEFSMAFTTTSLGSAIEAFTDFQLAQYVIEYSVFGSIESASPVLDLLETKDYTFLFNFLSTLTVGNYNQEILYRLLNDLIIKINASDAVCRPNLKTIFQGKLSFLFRAINSSILEIIYFKDCTEFQDFFAAVDEVYNDLSEEQQQTVFDYRLKFLDAEALKLGGSACTYGLSSLQWLEINFGQSVSFLAYAEMIRLNSKFNGYEALSVFSSNQTLDLVIQSNILTSESPENFELQVTFLISFFKTKGFVFVQDFLRELRLILIRINIKFIVNLNVRTQLLKGIWGIVETRFSQFTANDYYTWFNEYLYLVLPSITSEQLSSITYTVVEDCSNLQTIVGGLDDGFQYMGKETKQDVGKWIAGILSNATDKCLGDNWLEINFKHFKAFVSIKVIKELNPDFSLANSLTELTAVQIGEAVVTETTALSDVTFMETVFNVITNTSTPVENLGIFWDSFNSKYEAVTQFSEEVKFKMLEWTTDEISVKFSTFKAKDYTLWFETRLYLVTVVINSTILAEFPLTADCGSYKAFVKALSKNYDNTVESSKEDVLDFMTNFLEKGTKCTEDSTVSYLESSFGNYIAEASYEELASHFTSFNPFESGVFEKLTDVQLGDMIVDAKVYESQENAVKVFQYLQTRSVESVDAAMTQFTATAKKKNIEIDAPVGQTMLKSYLNIVKFPLLTYNRTERKDLFKKRVSLMIRFFNEDDLDMFAVNDCDTLGDITGELDTEFARMSEETRTGIARWTLGRLKSTNLSGCKTKTQTTSEWVESTFKQFFAYTNIKEVQEVYSSLDIISVMNNTSINQKVEYLVSSQDILQNVSTTTTVLESLAESDGSVSVSSIYTFLDQFNVAYGELNVKSMTTEVREKCMTFLFTNLISDLNSVTTEKISQFQTKFKYFLSGISIASADKIPVTISCDVFEAIFSAFSSVFDQLSEDVAKFLYNKIIKFLQANYKSSSDVCSSLYTDSKSYVLKIFFKFLKFATISDIQFYYSKVNMYKILTELTGKQLGNLLINSTAIRNQFEAIQILVEVETREYAEVKSFMSEITTVAKEQNIVTLPDENIGKAIYETVWKSVSTNLKTEEDYKFWLDDDNLNLIITKVPAEAIQALPESPDCKSQSKVVKAFGKKFKELNEDQKKSMHDQIKKFNTGVKSTKGQACETTSGSSSEWVKTFYSEFVELATLRELKEANSNFSAAESLSVISGVQVADFAIETKALLKEETTVAILESMDSTQKIEDFLTQINEVSPNDLKFSPFVDIIVSKTFEVISKDFVSFTREKWTVWTQEILTNILFAVNATEVESIPLPLSCDSYHEVVTGFNKVFDDMKEETKRTVYNKCMKRQLSNTPAQNGVRCGKQSWKSAEWTNINFGKFSIYANLTELYEWNVNLQTTDIISTLSPDQLGEVAVTSIEKEEVACQVAGQVQQFTAEDTYSFLDSFVVSFQQSGKTKITSNTIGNKFLSATISSISSSFSGYKKSDWEKLFSDRLQLFLFSINEELLTTILASADCDGYAVCVNALNSVFDELTNAESLVEVLKSFLNKQSSTSGACPVSGEDSSASATRVFGKFLKFVTYADLVTYIPTFDGLSAIDLLSPNQKANLAFTDGILTDATKAQPLVDSVSSMIFIDLDSFLSKVSDILQQRSLSSLPNAKIQGSLFSAMYPTISQQFLQLSNEQWANYWNFKLSIFLPSLTVSQVQQIPDSINCNAFQSIISGCSNRYSFLTESVQKAIYEKAKSFLTAKATASGPGCPVISGGSGGWLDANLGLFSEFATIAEIKAFYPSFSFTDAVPYLTASQLGFYVANLEVLSDKDKIQKVMVGITSDTIGEFMDSFNEGATAAGITQIANVVVKNFFLGEVFCKLGSVFASFTASNYSEWFQGRLKFFNSALDAKALGFIPTDISCDSLAAIMEALNTATHPENLEDVYSFIKSVLEAQQTSTGDACTTGLDSKQWLGKYYGIYSSPASWSEFITFYPGLVATEVASFLTPTQLASASTSGSVNSSSISTLLLSFSGSLDEFLTYLGTLRNSFLLDSTLLSNTKVRDILLMVIAENAFSQFGNFDLQKTQNWLTATSFLFSGLNSTILEQIPVDISCDQFQAIVSAVDNVFTTLTKPRKEDFAAFQKRYLTSRFTEFEDACSIGITSTVSYIQKNIGLFCAFLPADQVKLFYPEVNELHLIYFLSPEELAKLTVKLTLNSVYNTTLILALIESAPYSNLTAYARQFNIAAREANLTVLPNPEVRDAMLAVFLGRLKPYYKYFPQELWGKWFSGYLPLLLPGINETDISLLPTNVSCVSYQSVVNGLNQAYEYLPLPIRISFYNIYIKSFWNNKALTHDGCNYTNPIQWIQDNLGNFTNQANFQDVLGFNENLTKVSTSLTVKVGRRTVV